MAIYSGFRLGQSTKTNTFQNKERNSAIIKSLAYLQEKNDKVLEKKDAVSIALEDIVSSDADKSTTKEFKDNLSEQLKGINDSEYVGDYDRQVNKLTAKAKKGIDEIQGNYKAEQEYIKEAKKAGLSDEDLQGHLALSKVKGGLKYDKTTGQFDNRFQGYSIAEPVDQKLVREAVATMKPSKYKYDDGLGNTVTKETYKTISPEDAEKIIKSKKLDGNAQRELIAGVERYQNLEAYYKTSPEFQKRQKYQRDLAITKANSLNPSKLTDEGKSELLGYMQKYGTTNPREAYASYLADKEDKKGFGQVLNFANLREQDDVSTEWSERSKFGAMTAREIQMEGLRNKHTRENIFLKDALDQQAEKRKEEGIVINDLGNVNNNPNLPDGVEENSPFKKLGMKLVNTLLPNGIPLDGNKKPIFSKAEINRKYEDFGEIGKNIGLRDSPNFKKAYKDANDPTVSKQGKEDAAKYMSDWVLKNEEKIAKEAKTIMNYQVPLERNISEKENKREKNLVEQLIGNNLNGWARSFNAREIGEDGKMSPVATFGSILEDTDAYEPDGKEFKKALNDANGLAKIDGFRPSDGELGRGVQVTIRNPDDGSSHTYAIEIPQLARAYKGKNSVLTEQEAIRAKLARGLDTIDKRVDYNEVNDRGYYKVYNKKGSLLDTYTVDRNGKLIAN